MDARPFSSDKPTRSEQTLSHPVGAAFENKRLATKIIVSEYGLYTSLRFIFLTDHFYRKLHLPDENKTEINIT
jgi:hypothetical protein